ncbi:MAG: LON peptidase substrate-binding domain-containing protein [Pseudobdellovibrionaceae bacterium]
MQKPLFSTVNSVVFPKSSTVFIIRRDFSINSVKEAMKNHHNQLVITSQKSMTTEIPDFDGIFHTGCLCEITNHIELPDGTVKFEADAISRVKINKLIDQNGTRFADVRPYTDPTSQNLISLTHKEELLNQLRSADLDLDDEEYVRLMNLEPSLPDYDFVMVFCRFLRMSVIKHRELTFAEINKGLKIWDVLTPTELKKVDEGMAEMQKILESEDYTSSVKKFEELLGTRR